jgi:hypothetical protein
MQGRDRPMYQKIYRGPAGGRENNRRDHRDHEFPFWTDLAGVTHEVLPRGKHTAAEPGAPLGTLA